MIFVLAILIFYLACSWIIFEKANMPGIYSIIPIVNIYCMYQIAFGNGLYALLLLVPFVNVIMGILLMFKLAEAFGKSFLFGLGLLFLSFIFIPILAFGNASYIDQQKRFY